jgi:hypothetical protein
MTSLQVSFRRIRNEISLYPAMELVCEEVPYGFLATVSHVIQKDGRLMKNKSNIYN